VITSVANSQDQNLCNGLSFALAHGESLIVTGPSGCGKSSIVRAIAGLFREGFGVIERPSDTATVFLPQKPYLPMASTLRACLLYPNYGQAGIQDESFDEEISSLLRELNLNHILGEGWGLSSKRDWSSVLSLGEQQRLQWIRMLISNPVCVVADEATSALDEPNEARMYHLLCKRCSTFISIGHRPSLSRWHTHSLSFMGDGKWAFKSALPSSVA